jgi:hypothetical protein
VFSFTSPITFPGVASVIDVSGGVAGSAVATASGSDVHVSLTGILDNKRVTVSLANVNASGLYSSAAIAFLVGDADATRSVTSSDVVAIKARSGQSIDASTFHLDANASGAVTSSDILAAKGRLGLNTP